MATLGDILREAREARGISLSEAERETKIRQKYISALEDDNLANLPGPVYARGFLKNYASFLGIDVTEAMELFEEQMQPTRDKIKVARGHQPTRAKGNLGTEKISIQPLSPEPIDTRVRYGISYIAVSLIALPLIIIFYFIYSAYAGRSRDVPIPTVQARPATVTPLPTMSIPVVEASGTGDFNTPTVLVPATPGGTIALETITPTVPVAVGDVTATAQAVPAAENVTVRVVTSRDAWMRVLVDNVQVYSGTLPRGATREWEGRNLVRIRTGRADSVTITVNGRDLGLMGSRNNLIVEKEWNRNGSERTIR